MNLSEKQSKFHQRVVDRLMRKVHESNQLSSNDNIQKFCNLLNLNLYEQQNNQEKVQFFKERLGYVDQAQPQVTVTEANKPQCIPTKQVNNTIIKSNNDDLFDGGDQTGYTLKGADQIERYLNHGNIKIVNFLANDVDGLGKSFCLGHQQEIIHVADEDRKKGKNKDDKDEQNKATADKLNNFEMDNCIMCLESQDKVSYDVVVKSVKFRGYL